MNDSLIELELRLQNTPRKAPPADLRSRVLTAVADELVIRPKTIWPWPAIAAGVLIVLNLSAIWASQDQFRLSQIADRDVSISEIHLLRMMEAQLQGVGQ